MINIKTKGKHTPAMPGAGSAVPAGQRLQEEVSGAVLGHGLTSASLGGDKALSGELMSKVTSESWETLGSPQSGAWQD